MQVEHNFLAALAVLFGALALVGVIAFAAGVPESHRLRRLWRRILRRLGDRDP